MKKIIILLFILICAVKLQAQFAIPSYQAINTSVYNPIDGSMEFTPTYTSGTPNNNQYLSIPPSSNFEFAGDFTVECWVNFKNVSGVYQSFLGQYTSGTPWLLQLMSNKQLRLTGAYGADVLSSTLEINTWYHIALVRSGSSFKIYVNGVNNGSTTIAIGTKIGDGTKINTIGAGDAAGNDRFNGFISNVRFVKGTAVYSSNFTPPTARLTAIPGTTLLLNTTNDAKYLKDNSLNNATVTSYNSASTTAGLAVSSPLNPFNFASNGLIVNLDATNASSYPGTGNTWTNGPSFESGSTANLYFNKPTSADLQQYGTININTGATNAWTMEVIAKIPNKSLWTTTPFVVIADLLGYNQRGVYIGVQGVTINYSPSGNNFQSYNFTNDKWYVITVVHSSNVDALYLNGELQGSWVYANNDNLMGRNAVNALYLGNPPSNPANTVQALKISRFKYYSRALNVSEIGSNYSAQKVKYGL
jgi:hypothetical protein